MSHIYCLIILVVAVQSVLTGFTVQSGLTGFTAKDVQQIYIQTMVLENAKSGLTKNPGRYFGKDTKTPRIVNPNDTVENAITEILKVDGIAYAPMVGTTEHTIVVPEALKDSFRLGTAFFYYKTGGAAGRSDTVHLKIITYYEKYYSTGHMEIMYKSLEFTSKSPFGNLFLTFGAVNPGLFYKEKSKKGGDDEKTLIQTSFLQLKSQLIPQVFTPEFKDNTVKTHAVLSKVKGKITQFTVTASSGAGEKTLVIHDNSPEGYLNQTLIQFAYESSVPTADVAIADSKFKYTIAFTYTPGM